MGFQVTGKVSQIEHQQLQTENAELQRQLQEALAYRHVVMMAYYAQSLLCTSLSVAMSSGTLLGTVLQVVISGTGLPAKPGLR